MESNFLLDVHTLTILNNTCTRCSEDIPTWTNCVTGWMNCQKNKMIYTFCAVGLRGYLNPSRIHNFMYMVEKVRNLSGGFENIPRCRSTIILREN